VSAFPSPADWRDVVIYFLLVDRFSNPNSQPQHPPWDAPFDGWQGVPLPASATILTTSPISASARSGCRPSSRLTAPTTVTDPGLSGRRAAIASDPADARTQPGRAEAELRQLVYAAHEREIYVILDIVLTTRATYSSTQGWALSRLGGRCLRPDRLAAGRRETGAAAARRAVPATGKRLPAEPHARSWRRLLRLKELVTDYLDAHTGRYPLRDTLIAAYPSSTMTSTVFGSTRPSTSSALSRCCSATPCASSP
jgi:hypothetical protein